MSTTRHHQNDKAKVHSVTPWSPTITLAMTTRDRQCGLMNGRNDGKPTTIRKFYIPKNERSKQKPFDKELQAKFEWLSQNWMTHFAQSSSCSSSSQNWWAT